MKALVESLTFSTYSTIDILSSLSQPSIYLGICNHIYPSNLRIVWNFQEFSIIQILREINFSDSKQTESAILTHLEVLNCNFYDSLHF